MFLIMTFIVNHRNPGARVLQIIFLKQIDKRQCKLKTVVMAWHPCHISFFVQLKLFYVNTISSSRN